MGVVKNQKMKLTDGLYSPKNEKELKKIIDDFHLTAITSLDFPQKPSTTNGATSNITWKNPHEEVFCLKVATLRQQLSLTPHPELRQQIQQELAKILYCLPSTSLKELDKLIHKRKIPIPPINTNNRAAINRHKTLITLLALHDEFYQNPPLEKNVTVLRQNQHDIMLVLHDFIEKTSLDNIDSSNMEIRLKDIVENYKGQERNWQIQKATIVTLRSEYDLCTEPYQKFQISLALAELLDIPLRKMSKAPHQSHFFKTKMDLCDKEIKNHGIIVPDYNKRQKHINEILMALSVYKQKNQIANIDKSLIDQLIYFLIRDDIQKTEALIEQLSDAKTQQAIGKMFAKLNKNISDTAMQNYLKLRNLFSLFINHRYCAFGINNLSGRLFDDDFYEIIKIFSNTVNHEVTIDYPCHIGNKKHTKIDRLAQLYIQHFSEDNPDDPQKQLEDFSQSIIVLIEQLESVNFKDYGYSIPNKEKINTLEHLRRHFNEVARKYNIKKKISIQSRAKRLYYHCQGMLTCFPAEEREAYQKNIRSVIFPVTEEKIDHLPEKKIKKLERFHNKLKKKYDLIPLKKMEDDDENGNLIDVKSRLQNRIEYLLSCIKNHGIKTWEYKLLKYNFQTYLKLEDYQRLKKLLLQITAYIEDYNRNNSSAPIIYYERKTRLFTVSNTFPRKTTFNKQHYQYVGAIIGYISKVFTWIMAVGQGFLLFYELMGFATMFGPFPIFPIALVMGIYYVKCNYSLVTMETKNFLTRLFRDRDIWFGFTSKGGKVLMLGIWLLSFAMASTLLVMTIVSIVGLPATWPILAPLSMFLLVTGIFIGIPTFITMIAVAVSNFANLANSLANYLEYHFPEIATYGWGFSGLVKGMLEGTGRMLSVLTASNINMWLKQFGQYLKNPTGDPAASRRDINLKRIELGLKVVIVPICWLTGIALCILFCIALTKAWNAQLAQSFNSLNDIVNKTLGHIFKIVVSLPNWYKQYVIVGFYTVLTNVFINTVNFRTFHKFSIAMGTVIVDYLLMPLFITFPVFTYRIIGECLFGRKPSPDSTSALNTLTTFFSKAKKNITYFFKYLWTDPHQTLFPLITAISSSPLAYPSFALRACNAAAGTLKLDIGGSSYSSSIKTSASFIDTSSYNYDSFKEVYMIKDPTMFLPIQDIEDKKSDLLNEIRMQLDNPPFDIQQKYLKHVNTLFPKKTPTKEELTELAPLDLAGTPPKRLSRILDR